MNIANECLVCLKNQAEKACVLTNATHDQAKLIRRKTDEILSDFEVGSVPPPVVAVPIYEMISEVTKLQDPIAKYKQESTKLAKKHIDQVRSRVQNSHDQMRSALMAAIAGNVLDFASQKEFDLSCELDRVFDTPLAVDRTEELIRRIESVKSVLLLADNAGEHIFDQVLLEVLHTHNPTQKLYYATRGKPAINDITCDEAVADGLGRFATVISSGVDTAGILLERANKEFVELFKSSDLIISKGMGNFECLESSGYSNLFFLFKIKCEVVARVVGQPEGSLVVL